MMIPTLPVGPGGTATCAQIVAYRSPADAALGTVMVARKWRVRCGGTSRAGRSKTIQLVTAS